MRNIITLLSFMHGVTHTQVNTHDDLHIYIGPCLGGHLTMYIPHMHMVNP